jgi:hypothetical protein
MFVLFLDFGQPKSTGASHKHTNSCPLQVFFFPVNSIVAGASSGFFSGDQNQEIGQTFLFKGHKIGASSYFGADSAIKCNGM